ncbi:MAG TPA: hypothetical protein DD734_05455 [Firmicutes bacterium]|nr:hypothetical protein [Bacillota bacterium]
MGILRKRQSIQSGARWWAQFGLVFLVCLIFSSGGNSSVKAAADPLHFKQHLLDQAGLLSVEAAGEVDYLLAEFEQATGNQFLVAILPALPPGEALETYTLQVVENARAGQAGKDNGLLLLVSLAEQAIRIEVGTGLEGQINDGRAGRVIREILAPAFRNNNYGAGITQALVQLMSWVEPSFTPTGQDSPPLNEDSGTGALFYLLVFVVLFLLSAASSRRNKRHLSKRGYTQPTSGPIIMPSNRPPFSKPKSSSSRSGGFRSGGFRGGGGGFRGGGASGGW